MSAAPFLLQRLPGLQDYLTTLEAMRTFTSQRGPDTRDEIWLLEHLPVFTLGQAGRREHLLNPGTIPVIQADRGGQVTYHGPGQLVAYLMLDLRHFGLGVKRMVNLVEQCVIDLLAGYGIEADRRDQAPGVYVAGAKIASLGLRIRNGCSYHGLALNVAMDLGPFQRINPCGYAGLAMTQLSHFVSGISVAEAGSALARALGVILDNRANTRPPAQQKQAASRSQPNSGEL